MRLPFVNHSEFRAARVALLLASGGCAALRHSQPEDETDVVTVMIVNNHTLNVAVFNVAHGRRDRLGEVTAMASSSFKLHLRRLPANEIQLRADPIGSPRPVTSELLRVSPDDLVHGRSNRTWPDRTSRFAEQRTGLLRAAFVDLTAPEEAEPVAAEGLT